MVEAQFEWMRVVVVDSLTVDVSCDRFEIGDADRLRKIAVLPCDSESARRATFEPLNQRRDCDVRSKLHEYMNVITGVPHGEWTTVEIDASLTHATLESVVELRR